MARIYLDTNIYINLTKRNKLELELLRGHLLFISTLSTHVLFYSLKLKVPDKEVEKFHKIFGYVPFTQFILDKGLVGPTKDLEDNIQLHSAAETECDYFLTNDKNLLKMKFFGKVQIKSSLEN